MHLHEFQAKELLLKAGIPCPEFFVFSTLEECARELEERGWQEVVLKIQVHAGGRGKAGGVLVAKSKQQALAAAEKLLGMCCVNGQTGPLGMVAHSVLVSPVVNIAKEYYLGAIVDRKAAQAVLMASKEGGMEIEEIAKNSEALISVPITLEGSLHFYHLIQLFNYLGWDWKKDKARVELIQNLARLFIESEATLLEINPLVDTAEGRILALDAKMSLDENALFRHADLASYEDLTQLPEQEAQAKKHNLSYIAMEGTIGCMVNGAGLAMATMDSIHYYGGSAANFLDVGGSATQEKVSAGFQIILSDPKVSVLLVNIFGGIMNCVTIAAAIIAVASEREIGLPLVVRMEGTNVEKGKQMLLDSGLQIVVVNDLSQAAQKAVELAGG